MLTYLICPSVQNVFIECFQKIRTCFKFKAQHVLVQRGLTGKFLPNTFLLTGFFYCITRPRYYRFRGATFNTGHC